MQDRDPTPGLCVWTLSAVSSQTKLVRDVPGLQARRRMVEERDDLWGKKTSHQWFIGEQLLAKFNLRLLMNPHIHQASFQLIKETQKAEEAQVLDESLGKPTNLLHSSADVYNYFIISFW